MGDKVIIRLKILYSCERCSLLTVSRISISDMVILYTHDDGERKRNSMEKRDGRQRGKGCKNFLVFFFFFACRRASSCYFALFRTPRLT